MHGTEIENKKTEYENGVENAVIRWYYYLNGGLGTLNNFRNLFLAVFGLYVVMKLTNPLWLVVMFAVSIPILILIGYINLHRIQRVHEWLNVKFGSHYNIRQFDYVKAQYETMKEIQKLLAKK